ncbi:MAG: type II toxin-antitoxin system MqsA family antitoxin [Pseudobutyrivibrio ruminis]|nr:type II toxin-antitoxin system MqsA family antitoxin [Pseudobutyrivibrio ruminis]
MCNACFSEDKLNTKTTFTVEYNDCIIVVKNVPCLECPICGEITFTDDVSAKLEVLVESAKKIMQEISVIDYQKAA